MTQTEGQQSVVRQKEAYQLTKVIKLKFISIRMSENVTLIHFLAEKNSLVQERRRKKAINAKTVIKQTFIYRNCHRLLHVFWFGNFLW